MGIWLFPLQAMMDSVFVIFKYKPLYKLIFKGRWDGSEFKSMYFSWREPKFGFQNQL